MVNASKVPSVGMVSDVDEQKVRVIIDTVCMQEKETWYVLSASWYNKWSNYVQAVANGEDCSTLHPGPIDNESILNREKPGHLVDGLVEKIDYIVVPELAWQILFDKYAIQKDQQPIQRNVIRLCSSAEEKGRLMIEVYVLMLTVQLNDDDDSSREMIFSKADDFYNMKREICRQFRLNGDIRLYVKIEGGELSLLSPKNAHTQLDELGLIPHQTIVVDFTVNGIWHISENTNKKSIGDFGPSSSRLGLRCRARGLCGLSNLGNTCFMNSAIQCLSNVPPLNHFFLSNKYKADLNYHNPLGSRGEVVKAYVDLINNMWSGNHTTFVPSALRQVIGRYQPMFNGYQQHDAQELMAYLLDALHEDLNRVTDKPYIESKEADNLPDEVLADRTWSYHKKRNDSIITDLFVGLLKSTVICPDCHKVSVTFDPYGLLSLPLPEKVDKQLSVTFVPMNPKMPTVQHQIGISKTHTAKDAIKMLSQLVNIPSDRLILTEYNGSNFILKLPNDVFSQSFGSRDRTQWRWIAFEVEYPVGLKDGLTVHVYQLHFRDDDWTVDKESCRIPIVIRLQWHGDMELRIQNAVQTALRRFVEPNYQKALVNAKNGNVCGSSDEGYNDEENGNGNICRPFVLERCSTLAVCLDSPLVGSDKCDSLSVAVKWNVDFEAHLIDELPGFERSVSDDSVRRSVHHNRIIELADCLDLFTTVEKLGERDAWYCPTCKRHQQATKKFDIWSLPEVLVVHLKRFSNDRVYRSKIPSLVNFPVKNLAMSKWVINKKYSNYLYDLVAVCNHEGSIGDGHYYAYGLNCLKNSWFTFNDSCVNEMHDAEIVSKMAYVLVYIRKNSKLSLNITVGNDNEDGGMSD